MKKLLIAACMTALAMAAQAETGKFQTEYSQQGKAIGQELLKKYASQIEKFCAKDAANAEPCRKLMLEVAEEKRARTDAWAKVAYPAAE